MFDKFDKIEFDKFDSIKGAISEFAALIEKFAAMVSAFVDSWKKVPAASKDDDDAE